MFGRFFKKNDGEKVTKADLGQENSMYYDPVKKRWREKGKEHLEEEEKELAPPPTMGQLSEPKKEPEKEAAPATGVDALCGTPNMHRHIIKKPPAKGPGDEAAGGPPSGPSMPPMGGPFGTATPAANPFAPKGFGGTVSAQSNPNAPRGFGGAASMPTNPNAPRARDPKERRERPKPKPQPKTTTPFGAMPMHSPLPGVAPPAPGGGLPGVLPPGVLPPGVKPPEPAPSEEKRLLEGVPSTQHEFLDHFGEDEGLEKWEQAEVIQAADPDDPPTAESTESPEHKPPEVERVDPDVDPEGNSAVEPVPVKEEPAPVDPEGAVDDDVDPEGSATKLTEESSTPIAPDLVAEVLEPEIPAPAPAPAQLAESEAEEGEICESPPVEICESPPVVEPAESADEAKDLDLGITEAVEDTPVAPQDVVPTAQEVSVADFDDAFVEDKFPETAALTVDGVAASETAQTEEEATVEEPTAAVAQEIAPSADNSGWDDDFDMDEDVTQTQPPVAAVQEDVPEVPPAAEAEPTQPPAKAVEVADADDNGWGDFDDDNWGDDTAAETKAVEAKDETPTEELAEDAKVDEETTDAVEAVDAKGGATEVAEVGHVSKEPSCSGNGESISSWVDLGDEHSALMPPVVTAETEPETEEPPPKAANEEVPCVPEELTTTEDQKVELVPEEPAIEADAQTAVAEQADDSGLRQELEDLKISARAVFQQELEELKEANAKLKLQLAERDEERAELESKIGELEVDKVSLTSENSRIKTEVETLQATESNLSSELSSRTQALKAKDDEIQSLALKLQESEARAAEPPDAADATATAARVEELEEALKEAQRKIAEMEERLAATGIASTRLHSGELEPDLRSPDRTSYEMPDFVWNLEPPVMEYVQKLVTDNAVLKKQASSSTPAADTSQFSSAELQPAADNFDAKETDAEVACAFAKSISDLDGHQIQPLLSLLVIHGDHAQACFEICAALENLTFTDSEHRHAIVSNDGVEKILNFMEKHQDADSALIRPAVDALWNITFDDVAVDRMTESAGLLERFLSVVKKRQEASDLQAGACAVLLNLAAKEQNRWKIVQLDGVAYIAAVMKQHQQCEEVLEQGCQALYMLAYHQDLRPHVQSKCGEAASLAEFHQGARAQKWGRWLKEVLAC
jgi:hypothetical protein